MRAAWFQNAIFYAVDVSTFRDLDGDGWGDLAGTRERLDYLRALGVDCIWLQPFFPTPFRDMGYDIQDYLGVDRRFGDLADFAELIEAAESRGMRVLVDLVVQHTSSDHPWFQAARKDRDSPYRDYYIWADEPEEGGPEPVFPGVEDSIWAYDEVAGQYFRHLFYAHQPDLDVANPVVREEIFRVMAFWLRLGVAGFRIDGAPYIVDRVAKDDPDEDGHWFLRQLRDFLVQRKPDAVLAAETDVEPHEYARYFGDGEQLNMLFNFYFNNYLFLGLAREQAGPIAQALRDMPRPPPLCQYLTWLRNHDELDLGRLSEGERDEVMRAFAPEQNMRVFGRGIRRRPAPMFGNDRAKLALAYSLVFSVPGTPVLRAGDEIGMGDDLGRPERAAVRTPMQWSDTSNAGFSAADAEQLIRPVIDSGPYDYRSVNAHRQTLRHDSSLNVVARMARSRAGLHELGHGDFHVLDVGDDRVLGLCYRLGHSILVILNNLSRESAEAKLTGNFGPLGDVLADSTYPAPDGASARIQLNAYGYRWLRSRDTLLSSPLEHANSPVAIPPRPTSGHEPRGEDSRSAPRTVE